jgi:hypothetical protein
MSRPPHETAPRRARSPPRSGSRRRGIRPSGRACSPTVMRCGPPRGCRRRRVGRGQASSSRKPRTTSRALSQGGAPPLDAQPVLAGELVFPPCLDETDQLGRVDGRVGHELHAGALGGGFQAGDAQGLGANAQPVHRQQGARGFRRQAEAVDEFLLHRRQLALRRAVGQALVQHQPLVDVGAIGLRQQGGGVQVDLGGDG